MIVVAAVLRPSRQSDDEQVQRAGTAPEQLSNEELAAVPPAASNQRGDWFPDLSDTQPALTTGDTASGTSSRFDCSFDDFTKDTRNEEVAEELLERNRMLADTLSRSAFAEDQLASALLRMPTDEAGVRIESLELAIAADPTHPLVLWQVADDCRRGHGGSYCSDPDVRSNVEAILGGNGWYWVQMAAFYYDQGMFDESLRATQRAVTAPEFDDYFIDYVLLLERAFGADSDRSYVDRVVAAIGTAAARPADFFSRECSERSELDDAWLDSCTMLAERYERDGTNVLMQIIGLDMQEKFYAQSGLANEVRDAASRKAELGELLDRIDADYQLVQAVDPQVNARYLDVWESSGEVAALEYTIDAVDRLLEDPDYDPCVFLPSD